MEELTLYELNQYINQVIQMNFDRRIAVTGELGNVNSSGGHIYLELVERDDARDRQIARMRANIWRSTVSDLKKQHGKELLRELLTAGKEVKVKGEVRFHELYGLSFQVADIDPEYTMGTLNQKRREIIRRLKKEELLAKNNALPLPLVLQNIAVITSETAAGWADFREHLQTNAFGYHYHLQLHTARMQGHRTEEQVVQQLKAIDAGQYDCIVLIRGGGSSLDLSAFDSYPIGRAIADCPAPVVTGIGHEIDKTVPDLTAHTALKTPTAVAHFLLEHNEQFEQSLMERMKDLIQTLENRSGESMRQLTSLTDQLFHAQESALKESGRQLKYLNDRFAEASEYARTQKRQQLDRLEEQIDNLQPDHVLERGYSITQLDGRRITDVDTVEEGQKIATFIQNGTLESTIDKTTKNE